jgi:hypothetical protein
VEKNRKKSDPMIQANAKDTNGATVELTTEEQLLAALLDANERLQEAFRVYSELERLSNEHEVEERSRKEVRKERTVSLHSSVRQLLC